MVDDRMVTECALGAVWKKTAWIRLNKAHSSESTEENKLSVKVAVGMRTLYRSFGRLKEVNKLMKAVRVTMTKETAFWHPIRA
jgi:hypothetical protein